MAFHISVCKHNTKLILVSILTFSRSRISKILKTITWHWRLTLELKVTHIHCMTFLSSDCIHDADLILVSILTFTMSRISEIPQSFTWPWWLTLKVKVTIFCMTVHISVCKHDTKLILVDFNILEVEDIKNVENNYVALTNDLGTQGHTHFSYDLAYLRLYACYCLDLVSNIL